MYPKGSGFSLILLIALFCISYGIADEMSVPSAGADDSSMVIGIIPSGNSSPFHQELISAATSSAAEEGWKVVVLAPDFEENISAQKTAMRHLIGQNVSMISLNTLNGTALSTEIDDAISAGIPVLMHNTLTPVQNPNISAYIGYNQYKGGAEMGYYAVRRLAEKHNDAPETIQGKVFILRGLPGFHADQRTAGFKAALTQSPGIRIIGEEVAAWDRETARSIARTALVSDPDIEVFYGNSDEMAIGAAMAVMDQGKEVNRDVYCLGIDGNRPTLEMIRNGTMTATLGVYPSRIGKTIIREMKAIRNGKPSGLFLETPVIVVDRDNLDSYVEGSTWTGEKNSQPERLSLMY